MTFELSDLNLRKEDILREVETYFQDHEVKRLIEKNISAIIGIGNFKPEGRLNYNSDLDLIFVKEPGVPVGEYLNAQTRIVEMLTESIFDKLRVRLTAFPTQAVQDESVECSKVGVVKINQGLKTGNWENLYGKRVPDSDVRYWSNSLNDKTIDSVLGLHNLNYCRLKDLQSDTFCPQKFWQAINEGLLFYGSLDKANDLVGELNDEEIKVYMTLQDFNVINTTYPLELFRKKIGHGISYVNKHLLGKAMVDSSNWTREECAKIFYDTMTSIDIRIAAKFKSN